jgi:hypothetical protein
MNSKLRAMRVPVVGAWRMEMPNRKSDPIASPQRVIAAAAGKR